MASPWGFTHISKTLSRTDVLIWKAWLFEEDFIQDPNQNSTFNGLQALRWASMVLVLHQLQVFEDIALQQGSLPLVAHVWSFKPICSALKLHQTKESEKER
jgi:hypothetical protein